MSIHTRVATRSKPELSAREVRNFQTVDVFQQIQGHGGDLRGVSPPVLSRNAWEGPEKQNDKIINATCRFNRKLLPYTCNKPPTGHHHVSVANCLHFVDVVHLYPLVEAQVQTVQHVDHLERGTLGGDLSEPHDVTEENGGFTKLLRINDFVLL